MSNRSGRYDRPPSTSNAALPTAPSDFLGAALSVAGMVTLVYAFIHAARDGWNNAATYVLFPLAGLLLIAFVLTEAFVAEHPMMPIRLLQNRSRAGAYLIM